MIAVTIILALLAAYLVFIVPVVMVPRLRMLRRARALLAQYPEAETTSVYLSFQSWSPWGKQREMAAKISGFRTAGWTFLHSTGANPLITIHSLGGGLTLRFIRIPLPA